MTEIALVKRGKVILAEHESAVVRRVLFDAIDGLGELNRKRWRRFWNWLLKAEAGEVFTIVTRTKRSSPFHRRHMLIETRVFEAQERVTDFEAFRYWLKVGAGFVTWMPGPKGGVVPVPRSISYDRCEEGEMREFHENAIEFLRGPHASKWLWPKLPEAQRAEAMDALLTEFGE